MCQSRPDTKGGFCSFDAVREIGEVASHAYLAIPRTRVECMKTPADTGHQACMCHQLITAFAVAENAATPYWAASMG